MESPLSTISRLAIHISRFNDEHITMKRRNIIKRMYEQENKTSVTDSKIKLGSFYIGYRKNVMWFCGSP